eukprot:g77493.t1
MALSSATSKNVDNAFQLLHIWLVPVPDDITNDLFFSSDIDEQDDTGAEESDSDSEPGEDGDESDDDKEDKFEDDNKLCVLELLPNAILSQCINIQKCMCFMVLVLVILELVFVGKSLNFLQISESSTTFTVLSSAEEFDSSTTAEGVYVLNFGSSRRFLALYLHSRQVEISK